MPIETKAYACQFKCGARLYRVKKRMEFHESLCFSNPARRACKTCKHLLPSFFDPEERYNHPHCAAGVDLIRKGETECGHPIECDTFSLKFDCEKWEPKS